MNDFLLGMMMANIQIQKTGAYMLFCRFKSMPASDLGVRASRSPPTGAALSSPEEIL